MKPICFSDAKILKPMPRTHHADDAPSRRITGLMGTSMTFSKTIIAASLAFGMLTTASQAYSPEQQQLCTGDAMRLCGSEIPDVERVTACMIRQKAQLSDGCRSVFAPAPAATPVAYRTAPAKASKPMNLVPARVK
jgi:hypothetical protein